MFSTSYWDPFSRLMPYGFNPDPRMGSLRRRALRAFGDLDAERGQGATPSLDFQENEQGYTLTVALPGLTQKEISLEVQGRVLTLRAERKNEAPEGYTAHRQERPSYRVAQHFTVPSRIDVEKVEASLVDGLLTVSLPKAPEAHVRQITINAAANQGTAAKEIAS